MTLTPTPTLMACSPRWATPRRPERPTFGPELADIGRSLGQPLMPHQRLIADVGGEYDPVTGIPYYREIVVTIPRQHGKALSCDTPILTANRGWTSMAEIRAGDEVFHPAGHSTRVAFVSEVQTERDCYRVTTTDGRSVVADADHLWTVVDKRREKSVGSRGRRRRWFETRTLTTQEMVDEGLSRYAAGQRSSSVAGKLYATNEYRFVLPNQEPLKLPDVDLPIDPYLLGAWLGDGWSASAALTCHVDEVAHWRETVEAAGFIPTTRQQGGTEQTWKVGITCAAGPGRHARSFAGQLRKLGLLNDKHIPDLYLAAGVAQREALLQGLMDTDGTVEAKRGQAEFCSINRRLAEGVLFLARSLGWRATLREGRATLDGRDCGAKYRVLWTPVRTDPFIPFRLPRKVARIRPVDGGKGRTTLSVARIEPVESVPVRCIKVESPDGLFLAGRDLIPTHNTTLYLCFQLHRCLAPRWTQPQRSAFTAQSGKDARDKWLDELFPLIRSSRKLKPFIGRINEGMGNESIRFRNGSLIRLLSTSTSSGHSKTLHQAALDELWHDTDDRRQQGLRPAMITIPDAQLLVCSTAGTDESVILNEKVETGRAAVEQGIDRGVAYFEWSAPDDWDPDDHDDDSYFEFMPALCPDPPCRCGVDDGGWKHTITLGALAEERRALKKKPGEFARAYGNRKQSLGGEKPKIIDPKLWADLADTDPQRPAGAAFAIHVNGDRTEAFIAYAGRRDDGDYQVGIAEVLTRVSDVPGWLIERRKTWNPAATVVDSRSERLSLALRKAGIKLSEDIEQPQVGDLVIPTASDTAAAFGVFVDTARERGLRHADDVIANVALESAQTRKLAGGQTWDGDATAPLKAMSLALWAFEARAHLLVDSDYDVADSVY